MRSHLSLALVPAAALGLALTGCRSLPDPAAIPSDQPTPVVWNAATAKVLLNSTDRDSAVLASVLESQAPEGSTIYVNHLGYVFGPDGNVVFDPTSKQPLRVKTTVVAKLNSLKELAALAGVDDLTYEIGGRPYLLNLPDGLKHLDTCPVPLRLVVKGVQQASASSNLAAVIQARAAERDAILGGLAAVIRERYVGKDKVIQTLADGTVRIITASGEVAVGVLRAATPVGTAGDVAERLIVSLSPTDSPAAPLTNYEVAAK